MWKPWRGAVDSNRRAISNARAATTECSLRRLERAEVAFYLASVTTPAGSARHPA